MKKRVIQCCDDGTGHPKAPAATEEAQSAVPNHRTQTIPQRPARRLADLIREHGQEVACEGEHDEAHQP